MTSELIFYTTYLLIDNYIRVFSAVETLISIDILNVSKNAQHFLF